MAMSRRGQFRPFFAARRITSARVLAYVGAGFLIGLLGGYILMGTLHAFLEIGASAHHGHALPSGQESAGSGAQQQRQQAKPARKAGGSLPRTGDTVHVLATSNGNPYSNFQTRIMYETFKLAQKMPGGEKMVALTRILHRSVPDKLMDEIPTFHATPLQPKCDNWCEFPVSDRPNAVRQFLDAAKDDPSMIQAPWLLMIETDYVWVKPFVPGKAEDPASSSMAFPFGYIVPTYPTITTEMRKLYPEGRGPLSDVPGTGPAPALMRVDEWYKVTPDWERLTAQIEADEASKEALGWVREMYAFSAAAALQKVKLDLQLPPKSKLMIQPPADHRLGEAVFMHYTWGSIFMEGDQEVWRFDKRDFYDPKHETHTRPLKELPPFKEGWRLQDNVAITKDLYDTLNLMITTMNKGIANLKDLE